jgi:hypothetical protein
MRWWVLSSAFLRLRSFANAQTAGFDAITSPTQGQEVAVGSSLDITWEPSASYSRTWVLLHLAQVLHLRRNLRHLHHQQHPQYLLVRHYPHRPSLTRVHRHLLQVNPRSRVLHNRPAPQVLQSPLLLRTKVSQQVQSWDWGWRCTRRMPYHWSHSIGILVRPTSCQPKIQSERYCRHS